MSSNMWEEKVGEIWEEKVGQVWEDDDLEDIEIKRRKMEPSPLEVENVIKKLFSFLDVPSIKLAREVNRQWSVEGAKALLTKCFIKIKWDHLDKAYLNFIHGATKGSVNYSAIKARDMNKFKAFLSSNSSDASTMCIQKVIIGSDQDLGFWKSFGVLGDHLTSLKFFNINRNEEFLINLLEKLPNLEYLAFDQTQNNFYYVENILNALISMMMMKKKKNGSEKPLIISELYLRPARMEDLECLEKFADLTNIMIEKLSFIIAPELFSSSPSDPVHTRASKMMSKILSTSKNTLKSLTLEDCETFLFLLKFPRLTALKYLKLDLYPTREQLSHCRFSSSFKFSENAPNLKRIDIASRGLQSGPNFFAHLFKETGSAASVRCITYADAFADCKIEPLFQTFPKIEELRLFKTACSRTMFTALWKKGKKLKKLDIDVNLDRIIGSITEWESIFTGFSSEIAREMKNHPELSPYILEEVEKLRVNPSILNLKGLRRLRITFSGNARKHLPKRFLAVVAELAFELMPKDGRIVINVENCLPYPNYARDTFDKRLFKLPNVFVE